MRGIRVIQFLGYSLDTPLTVMLGALDFRALMAQGFSPLASMTKSAVSSQSIEVSFVTGLMAGYSTLLAQC